MSSTNPAYVSGSNTASTNVWLSGLNWGSYWDTPGSDTAVIYYYVAGEEFLRFGDASSASTADFDFVNADAPTFAERAGIEAAMQMFSNVANISFVQTADRAQADLVWAFSASYPFGAYGAACTPDGFFDSTIGDWQSAVVINTSNYEVSANGNGLVPGAFDFVTAIHELGHALGMAHPHDDAGSSTIFPGVTSEFGDYGDFGMNQGIFTMMSYNDGWPSRTGARFNPLTGWQGTPMALDVAWLQAVYGANASFAQGDDIYDFTTSSVLSCIWDAGGVDVITYSGSSDCTIDLRAATLDYAQGGGGFVSSVDGSSVVGAFTIAAGVVVENATAGSGNDTLVGNDSANILRGGAGNDTIDGGAGNDVLFGGTGNNKLSGGKGVDTIDYSNATARLTVGLGASVTGSGFTDTLSSIENFIGGAFGDEIAGTDADNLLDGAAGNDLIQGLGGNDVLRGGTGIDQLSGDGGDDTLEGGAGIDSLSGGAGNDVLLGGDGNDWLFGDDGDDTQIGGAGSDLIFWGQGNDVLDGGEGRDSVDCSGVQGRLTVNLGLATQQNTGAAGFDTFISIEEFKSGAYGSFNDTLTGSDANNVIYSYDGNDSLYGGGGNDYLHAGEGNDVIGGGAGNDVMIGYGGNDTADYSDLSSRVTVNLKLIDFQDTGAGGSDRLSGIENIRSGAGDDLISGSSARNVLDGGAGNDKLFGNLGNDTLIGGAGNDIMNGGAGNDRMEGGSGNDLYYIDSSEDLIVERAGGGIDTAYSAVSNTLASAIENLLLTGSEASSATGNDLANRIRGNAGANTIDGGLGRDTLTGGAGGDAFHFCTTLGGSNTDTITDFTVGTDYFELDDAVFASLVAGVLSDGAFHVGRTAGDASDRIVYDAATGTLYYDADGKGGQAQTRFAIVDVNLTLDAQDFVIV